MSSYTLPTNTQSASLFSFQNICSQLELEVEYSGEYGQPIVGGVNVASSNLATKNSKRSIPSEIRHRNLSQTRKNAETMYR